MSPSDFPSPSSYSSLAGSPSIKQTLETSSPPSGHVKVQLKPPPSRHVKEQLQESSKKDAGSPGHDKGSSGASS